MDEQLFEKQFREMSEVAENMKVQGDLEGAAFIEQHIQRERLAFRSMQIRLHPETLERPAA